MMRDMASQDEKVTCYVPFERCDYIKPRPRSKTASTGNRLRRRWRKMPS